MGGSRGKPLVKKWPTGGGSTLCPLGIGRFGGCLGSLRGAERLFEAANCFSMLSTWVSSGNPSTPTLPFLAPVFPFPFNTI